MSGHLPASRRCLGGAGFAAFMPLAYRSFGCGPALKARMGDGDKKTSSFSLFGGSKPKRVTARPPPPLSKGKLFGYEIIKPLGQGAASRIYEVKEIATGRSYALKHVIRRSAGEERFMDQLRAEYDIGRRVQHTSLRKSFFLLEQKRWFASSKEAVLVLELIRGQLLPVPEPNLGNAMRMMGQLGGAVAALHAAGFIHCDLKPHNLLLDEAQNLRLIDLGQTCPVGTAKTRIQGTPEYMAPEQLRCRPVFPKTDVFGWGATFYKLLTGVSLPTLFTVSKGGVNSFLLDDTIRPPNVLSPNVPQELSELVMSCVRTAADKRPELKDVLARLAELQAEPAGPVGDQVAAGQSITAAIANQNPPIPPTTLSAT